MSCDLTTLSVGAIVSGVNEIPEELHGQALRRIAAIKRQQHQLEQDLLDAIVAARAVGTPVTRIAEEAELSRDTIYRVLRAAQRRDQQSGNPAEKD